MTAERMTLADITLLIPAGWQDVSEDQAQGGPLALARSGGRGALQFSIGRYVAGPRPNFSIAELRELMNDFGTAKGLGPVREVRSGGERTMHFFSDFSTGDDLIWAWYISDGANIALVTYVADVPAPGDAAAEAECAEAADIAVSLEF